MAVMIGLCSCNLIAPAATAKLYFACLPEHTLVDTPAGARPIEMLEPGDTIIGFSGKPTRILQKHSYLEHTNTLFLHLRFDSGSAVDLCGMHRLAGIRARDLQLGQTIAGQKIIGRESRRGVTRSYDLLTGDAGYRIQGIPVNSMIDEMNAAAASGRARLRREAKP
jgi:hypothetical protein